MTVAVSCNLSDGVILAVDSAVTVPSSTGVAKVYENAEKLFQFADRPIGVAFYGLGAIGTRTLGSHLREFVQRDPRGIATKGNSVGDVAESLRVFLNEAYEKEVAPALEQQTGRKFAQLQPNEIPVLGVVVGGFSPDAYLSEVWEAIVPAVGTGKAFQVRPQGQFGTNWWALYQPIQRYIKGYDLALLNEIAGYFVNKRGGEKLTEQENQELAAILNKHEFQIPYGAMPMQLGVEHARFLVELVINHHRFAAGAPLVGGRVSIGKVTYRGGGFEILAA